MAITNPKTIKEYQVYVKQLENDIDDLRLSQTQLEETVQNLMPTADLTDAVMVATQGLNAALLNYTAQYPNWGEYAFLRIPHLMEQALDILEDI